MTTINLKILYPNKDEKIVLNNIDLNQNVKFLKDRTSKKLNCSEDDLELIFLGKILDDTTFLTELGLTQWSFIHIILKEKERELRTFEEFKEEEMQQIAKSFGALNNSSLRKIAKPEAIQKILLEFPEIKSDTVAYIILTEPILLSSMQHIETLKKLNDHHRTLLAAAKLILSTIQEMTIAPRALPPSIQPDDLSDSSSSSSDSMGPSLPAASPTITRDRLVEALRFAVAQSQSSLSNIIRNTNPLQINNENVQSPSTSGRQNTRITSSMFSNALTRALNIRDGNDTDVPALPIVPPIITPPIITPPNEAQSDENIYATELQLMKEMGLYDVHLNLQALTLCNGNVDAAINLIFSGAIN